MWLAPGQMSAIPSAGAATSSRSGASSESSKIHRGRFYEAPWPVPNEIVVVKLDRVNEMGFWFQLLEYNGKVAFLPTGELSRRRMPESMLKANFADKLRKRYRRLVCAVVRVHKGNIDLSRTGLLPEVAAAKEEAFAKAKTMHAIMSCVASNNGVQVEELCKKVSWPLFRNHSDAFEALRRHVFGEIDLWSELDFSAPGTDLSGLASKLKSEVEAEMRRRLDQMMIHLRAKAEVSCFEYEGIDAVREALQQGSAASRPDCQLKIRLIAHPLFAIECACAKRDTGVQTIDTALNLIAKSIKQAGGFFRLRSHPDHADWELESEEESDEDDSESALGTDGEYGLDEHMPALIAAGDGLSAPEERKLS